MNDANTSWAKDLAILRNAEAVNRALYATKVDLAQLELSLTKLILIVALALGGLIILAVGPIR